MPDLQAKWATAEAAGLSANPLIVDNSRIKGEAYMDVPHNFFGCDLASQCPAIVSITVNGNLTPAVGNPRLNCLMSEAANGDGSWRFKAKFDVEVSIADTDSYSVEVIFSGTPFATAPEKDAWHTLSITRGGTEPGGGGDN